MSTQFTLNEILDKAIQKEILSRLLHIDLSQRMKDEVSKNAFQELAQQEQKHQNRLEQYRRGELKAGILSGGMYWIIRLPNIFINPKYLLICNSKTSSCLLPIAKCIHMSYTLLWAESILWEKPKNCLRS
jgi:Rubrerythrin